jgi:uncharacterized protein (TIGR00369 family)
MALLMNAEELTAYLHAGFPEGRLEERMRVEHVDEATLRLRLAVDTSNLRPGATLSGPTLFTMVDAAAWLLTVAHLGPDRDAVTSSATISFLRRPGLGDVVAEARLLRCGRRLTVSDVLVFSGDDERPVAQATVHYAPV